MNKWEHEVKYGRMGNIEKYGEITSIRNCEITEMHDSFTHGSLL